jgi:transcriptional regulator of met regulon
MDWSLPPDLQKKHDEIVARTRELQKELGIKPRTIEERYQDYLTREAEKQRRAEELAKFTQSLSQRRPPPNWKI